MNDPRQQAIDACIECHLICQETLAYHGDEMGGKQLSPNHIKRLMACIEICQVTENMLIIHAPLIDDLCEICARICEQCATSCSAINLPSMQQVAAACKHAAMKLHEESSQIRRAA